MHALEGAQMCGTSLAICLHLNSGVVLEHKCFQESKGRARDSAAGMDAVEGGVMGSSEGEAMRIRFA